MRMHMCPMVSCIFLIAVPAYGSILPGSWLLIACAVVPCFTCGGLGQRLSWCFSRGGLLQAEEVLTLCCVCLKVIRGRRTSDRERLKTQTRVFKSNSKDRMLYTRLHFSTGCLGHLFYSCGVIVTCHQHSNDHYHALRMSSDSAVLRCDVCNCMSPGFPSLPIKPSDN